MPGSPALEQEEERDSGGQINQARLPGGSGAGAGSINAYRLARPKAGLRALRTLGGKKMKRAWRKQGWMGDWQAENKSSEPWGFLVAAPLRQQSACDSDVEGGCGLQRESPS